MWWTDSAPSYGKGTKRECGCAKLSDSQDDMGDAAACVANDPYEPFFTGPDFGCIHYEQKRTACLDGDTVQVVESAAAVESGTGRHSREIYF